MYFFPCTGWDWDKPLDPAVFENWKCAIFPSINGLVGACIMKAIIWMHQFFDTLYGLDWRPFQLWIGFLVDLMHTDFVFYVFPIYLIPLLIGCLNDSSWGNYLRVRFNIDF